MVLFPLNLNKGLGAPYGALLCGPATAIERARPALRRIGAASIHQAGILAAACLAGLDHAIRQCEIDNRRAKDLGTGMSALGSAAIKVAPVETNIVLLHVGDAPVFQSALRRLGVLVARRDATSLRLVTHRHTGDEEVARAVAAVSEALH